MWIPIFVGAHGRAPYKPLALPPVLLYNAPTEETSSSFWQTYVRPAALTAKQIKEGTVVETAKGRRMAKGTCPECGTTVNRFLPSKKEG